MSLLAGWRKTVLRGMLVGCAGMTLQCGGGSSSTSNADAGASGDAAAGRATAGGAAGSAVGKAGNAGASSARGGASGEGPGGRGGTAQISGGSGGQEAGTGGLETAGTAGHSGSAVGGDAGRAGASASGAGGSDSGGSGSGGVAGIAGSASAGTSGGGELSAGGAAGSNGVAGSGGTSGAAGIGGSETAGSAGTAGASAGGAGGTSGAAGSTGSGGACGTGAVFRPRAPVVFFLLDRSSSMFSPTDSWSPLKASVLATISAYASHVRFGLAAYTGVMNQTCPLDLTSAGGIALDNYAPINQLLGALASPGVKAESPTAAALATVRADVLAQSGTSKTIFLVTDGGHDFCNDANAICPHDALVAQLQSAFTAGVQTTLFGIKGSPYLDLTQTQAQANAGSGLPVVGNALDTYYVCGSDPAWKTLWTAKGSPANQPLGSYVTSGTTNTPYTLLDTTQPDAMTSALKSATAALKSCTYDVTGAQVNVALAGQGVVRIDGVSVPMDASNGFRMNSSTELELVGSACANWRSAAAQTISFEFACSILGP